MELKLGQRVKAWCAEEGISNMVEGHISKLFDNGFMTIDVGGQKALCHTRHCQIFLDPSDDILVVGDIVSTTSIDFEDNEGLMAEGEVLTIEPDNTSGMVLLRTKNGQARGYLNGLTILTHRWLTDKARRWLTDTRDLLSA